MRLAYPKPQSLINPKSYKWHADWSVNVKTREAFHTSGAVFDFSPGWRGHLTPPRGDKCPGGAWKGALRGGTDSFPNCSETRAIRICLEACLLFSEMAWDVCQDCSEHTIGADYYMVNGALWEMAHPTNIGMLCISCLETRIGRKLQSYDFIDAPINVKNEKVQAIIQSSQIF